MLAFVKSLLRPLLLPSIYVGTFLVGLLSLFKDAKYGFFLMVYLVPQANLWHKMQSYPFGKDILDIIFFSILIGCFLQGKSRVKLSGGKYIILSLIYGYFSLWVSTFLFSFPPPITRAHPYLADFKNYVEMFLLYFLAAWVLKNEREQRIAVWIICGVLLLIAVRDYRNFDPGAVFRWERRSVGPFYAVNLGPNHMGAFFADYLPVMLGLFFFESSWRSRLVLMATLLFGLHPLLFSFSRGAYVAALAVLLVFGVLKKRLLLIFAFVIVVLWQTVLPPSVVNRLQMTVTSEGRIEHSAGGRLWLWGLAYHAFLEHPLFGSGWGGYSKSVAGQVDETGIELGETQDPHSIYMRVLSEQGIVGVVLFVVVLATSFRSGWRLFRTAELPFHKGLGLGFIGCVVSMVVTNAFGDRWSYFLLGGYYWILWGLVDRVLSNLAVQSSNQTNVALPATQVHKSA